MPPFCCGSSFAFWPGLGKTVQVAALFGALHTMGLLQPSLIVCPATVVAHWIRELTTWHPQLRVIALHASSSRALAPERVTARQMISAVIAGGSGHILVTTYEGLRVHQALLIPNSWSYVVVRKRHSLLFRIGWHIHTWRSLTRVTE